MIAQSLLILLAVVIGFGLRSLVGKKENLFDINNIKEAKKKAKIKIKRKLGLDESGLVDWQRPKTPEQKAEDKVMNDLNLSEKNADKEK